LFREKRKEFNLEPVQSFTPFSCVNKPFLVDTNLSPVARCLGANILCQWFEEGNPNVIQVAHRFAGSYGMSIKQVRTGLSDLLKEKYVEIAESGHGKRTLYRLLPKLTDFGAPSPTKTPKTDNNSVYYAE
jgi:hypothetical protein